MNNAAVPSNLATALEKSESTRVRIYEITGGRNFEARRGRAEAAASLTVAMSHYHAIQDLIEIEHRAPALALLRPLYEAAVRGLFLVQASESDLESEFKRKTVSSVQSMTQRIGSGPLGKNATTVLQGLYDDLYAALSDLNHTGKRAMSHHISPGVVEANFPDELIEAALELADRVMVIVALAYAHLFEDDAVAVELMSAVGVSVPPSAP